MKKIIKLMFSLILIFSLSGCLSLKTYDDLLDEYQNFIYENEANYQLHIDYFNHISTESIRSVVLVKKTSFGTSGSTTGSGVIYREDSLYYYALTNNHVVYSASGISATYQVSDYLGNDYQATKLASNPDYDLAIVRFRKNNASLDVIRFASENAVPSDWLAVMGYPSFQINAITLGSLIHYASITIENANPEMINVNFDIMVSDAPVKSGSSGSVVINQHFELVGIIYAGNFQNDASTATYSFAIPLDKVIEFLETADPLFGGEA